MNGPFKLSAAANMARDLALLEDNPESELRFRHYQWSEPSATFGYTQSLETVCKLTENWSVSLMRRPTGGGIVDHRNDWTYALIIPTAHSESKTRPLEIYKNIHEALRRSLEACDIESILATDAPCTPASTCFSGPVRYDLTSLSGRKIAGAAMKRTRNGILIQGSLAQLNDCFPKELADALKQNIEVWLHTAPLDYTEKSIDSEDAVFNQLHESYTSETWIKRRF